MKHSKKRVTAIILVLALVASIATLLFSCKKNVTAQGECNIKAAVYGSDSGSEVAYNQLRNGIMANIDAVRI